MPGELNAFEKKRKERLDRAMKAPYTVKKEREAKRYEDKIREAGL